MADDQGELVEEVFHPGLSGTGQEFNGVGVDVLNERIPRGCNDIRVSSPSRGTPIRITWYNSLNHVVQWFKLRGTPIRMSIRAKDN